MKVKIVNNEEYISCVMAWKKFRDKLHYWPGDIFSVVPYRYNTNGYYELDEFDINYQQLIRRIINSGKLNALVFDNNGIPIFWIDKKHTEIVDEYELPEGLFVI